MDEQSFLSKSFEDEIDTKEFRQHIIDEFKTAHANINCAHDLSDSLYMADYILRYKNSTGIMVEFGCFQGGMTAKLSHLAHALNKKYYVFDSFIGLLESATYETYDESYSHLGVFKKGEYASSLENTKSNVEKYGKIDNCVFVPGIIEVSLEEFDEEIMFCFIDVDLIPTAKEIIKKVWNKITTIGLFTHEACIRDYMKEILNSNFWMHNFNSKPPSCLSDYVKKQKKSHGLPLAGCLDFLIKQKSFNNEDTP
jgi:O-methyltransferase